MRVLAQDIGEVFHPLERRIAREKGEFTLFALLEREDVPDRWDLVVSAPWFGPNQHETVGYFIRQIQLQLGSAVMVALSCLVALDPSDPRVREITGSIPQVSHGRIELGVRTLIGMDIRQAIIITSHRQDQAA